MALLAAVACLLPACGRSLPKYEKPIARANFQHVRTTAYTHSEADHLVHGRKTCMGTELRCGTVNSAAADWSRWPKGTLFRIIDTNELYEVDDIGWALSGRNTIDLYKPSKSAMNTWGVRVVNIEVLQWGDDRESLGVLGRRTKHRHVRRMVDDLEKRVARGERNPEPIAIAATAVAASTVTSAPVPTAAVSTPAVAGGLRRRDL